jgi:Fe-S cluster biogenesis protein NfuA
VATIDEGRFRDQMQRLEALVHTAEQWNDSAARDTARELVQALLEVHGTALSSVCDILTQSGDLGRAALEACAAHPVVRPVLLLHGLHPSDAPTRIGEALVKVRPLLHGHGGDVELLGFDDGVVRLRLKGSCDGCPSSSETLRNAVEAAILDAAPEVERIVVEGNEPPRPALGLVSLPLVSDNGMSLTAREGHHR